MSDPLRFYLMEVSYRLIDDMPAIMLFGKTEEGKKIGVIDKSFRPYFLAKPDAEGSLGHRDGWLDLSFPERDAWVTHTEEVQKSLKGKDVRLQKIYANAPHAVPIVREAMKTTDGIQETFEYDIPYLRRYLIDKGLRPLSLVEIDAEPRQMTSRVPLYEMSSMRASEGGRLESFSILGFDIETYHPPGGIIDTKKNPIIMISLYGSRLRKVVTWKRFKTDLPYVEFVDSEAELIESFKKHLDQVRPDIITGYFSDGFDFPYLIDRARKYKISLDLGLDYSELTQKKGRGMTAMIAGITHLDMHAYVKNSFGRSMNLDSFSLDSVAKEILGEKKEEVSLDSLAEIWDTRPWELDSFCSYNLKDSELVFRLCEKLLPNIIELVRLIGLPMADVTRMGVSQLIEWFLIRRATEEGIVVPNKPSGEEARQRMAHTFQGAFVFQPKPGLYKDILIFDYRSLYPSIISAHNISPETIDCDCCREISDSQIADGHWFCKQKTGFIPSIVTDLITRRIRIKKMSAPGKGESFLSAKQQNLKLLANSFYGYLGFYGARWYSLESAEAVTAYGRYYIESVIRKAELKGFKVVYGDTDSIFLLLGKKTLPDAKKFVDLVNMELPEMMELEYEGYYPSGIFVKTKGGELGAKKRYALLNEQGRMLIKGFETVRRNWSTIGKDLQREVLGILLREHDPDKAIAHIKDTIQGLREGKIDISKLVISTQIQRRPSEYESIGPHVKAALIMEKKGIQVSPGMVISYVVTKGSGAIGERVKLPMDTEPDEIDDDYYINNQIIPAIDRILDLFGHSGEDVLEKKEQQKLDGFFS